MGKNGTVRRRKTDVAKAEEEKRERLQKESEEREFKGAQKWLWKDLEVSGREEGRRWGGYYVVRRGRKVREGE